MTSVVALFKLFDKAILHIIKGDLYGLDCCIWRTEKH